MAKALTSASKTSRILAVPAGELDESHNIVLTGFRRRDLEIGFCTSTEGNGAVLFVDRSKMRHPDSSEDLAAPCADCKAGHWVIDFTTALEEGNLDLAGGIIGVGLSELIVASLREGPDSPR